MEIKNGVQWYSISQSDDTKQWLTDNGVMGMIPVLSPMSSKTELYSNETLLDTEEAAGSRKSSEPPPHTHRPQRQKSTSTPFIFRPASKQPATEKARSRPLTLTD